MDKFQTMQEHLEELEDLKAYNAVKQRNEEKFPHDIAHKILLSDESNIRIIREHRKLSVSGVAASVGISEAYLSQVETGKRKGTIDLYKKLAAALEVDLDILIS